MAAAAAARSRMSLSLPSRQEDKDGALKLVSDSADTKAHAQWPKTGMARQRRILVWGYLLTANEDKSPQRFYSIDLLDLQRERLLHLYSPAEEDLLRSIWMKARFQ